MDPVQNAQLFVVHKIFKQGGAPPSDVNVGL